MPHGLPAIVTGPIQVAQALREIGLTPEIVRSIAVAAASARADAFAVDPIGSAGLLSYIHGVRETRLKLLPFGWKVARDGNVESTVNHERGVQLIFQNVFRACADSDPVAVSGKGPASRDLVKSGQQELFENVASVTGIQLGRAPTVWMICVSADEHSLRAEVSCPEAFEGDQFDGFVRRLFVVNETLDPKPSRRDDSDDDDFDLDIPVTKK